MAIPNFTNVFGPFGPALDPAMGRVLASNPESLIPWFAQQGISPPKDPMKLASLGGGGFGGGGGGQPPLESGYPAQSDVPPTSSPAETATDAIRGYRPEASPSEQPPASEPLGPGYKPPGPGEPGYVMQVPTRPIDQTPPAPAPAAPAPTGGPEVPYGHIAKPGDPEWVTDPAGFARRKYEEYFPGQVGGEAASMPVGEQPGTTTTGSAAAAAAPAAPPAAPAAPGAVAAPPMAAGTPFSTYGALGGLYPAAVPGGGAGSEAITGVPLPPSDPRQQGAGGAAAAKGGTTGKAQQDAISQLSKALAGVKAPPAPAAPQLRPHTDRGGNVTQNNPIASFLAQYMSGQGGAPSAAALRLYQTLGGK